MTATNPHIRNSGRGKAHQTSPNLPSIPHIKDGRKGGWLHNRHIGGGGRMGGCKTRIQRHRVDNIPADDDSGNLLAIDNFLNIYDYGTELNERNSGVPRHNQNLS